MENILISEYRQANVRLLLKLKCVYCTSICNSQRGPGQGGISKLVSTTVSAHPLTYVELGCRLPAGSKWSSFIFCIVDTGTSDIVKTVKHKQ